MNRRLGLLDAKKTVFMLCDVQEKFSAMKNFDAIVKNTKKLVNLFIVNKKYSSGENNKSNILSAHQVT